MQKPSDFSLVDQIDGDLSDRSSFTRTFLAGDDEIVFADESIGYRYDGRTHAVKARKLTAGSRAAMRRAQRGSATMGAMAIVLVLALLACGIAMVAAHPYLGISAYLGAAYTALVIFRDGAFK